MKVLTRIDNVFDSIIRVAFGFAVLLVGFMMLIVLVDVVARLLGKPLTGTIEIVEFSLLHVTFAGAAWVLRKDGHVKLDLVLNYLQPRPRAVVNTVTSIGVGLMFLLITWYSILAVWKSYQLGYTTYGILMLPKSILLLVIVLGSFLLFIECLRKAYQYLGSQRMPADSREQVST